MSILGTLFRPASAIVVLVAGTNAAAYWTVYTMDRLETAAENVILALPSLIDSGLGRPAVAHGSAVPVQVSRAERPGAETAVASDGSGDDEFWQGYGAESSGDSTVEAQGDSGLECEW